MRVGLLLGALLMAASASAQEPKVWTDADLAKPLPKLQREPEPVALAAMKDRADYIPNIGSRGAAAAIRASFAAPTTAAESPVAGFYARELALQRAAAAAQPTFYAAQPLYPFVSVVYSNRPYAYRPAVRPCPVPPVFRRR